MRNIIFTLCSIAFIMFGCDDLINVELDPTKDVLVIDAFITDASETQTIRLSKAQDYFSSNPYETVENATITITEEGTATNTYTFVGQGEGLYSWEPNTGEGFGVEGNIYKLSVELDGVMYTAETAKARVPQIDSITFSYEEEGFGFDGGYFAEFFALDPEGEGDFYWIKSWKNGQYSNKPSEINLAYDAAFSEGSDNEIFIYPIRVSITPIDVDEDGNTLPPLLDQDSMYVELHSLSEATYDYLQQVQIQSDRPGGFGELFASPLTNVPTNITNETNEGLVQGFFNVAAVSSLGKKLIESEWPKDE